MNFCSECGSGSMVYEVPKGDTIPRYICNQCKNIYYSNPKVVVGCIVQYQNQILLCKRNIMPQKGFLTYPAGYMENYETLQSACIRETREESGAQIDMPELFAIYNLPSNNQIFIVFHKQLQNQKLQQHDQETSEITWHDIDDIDDEKLAFPIIIESLKALQRGDTAPYQAIIIKNAGGVGYSHKVLEFPNIANTK